MKLDLSLDFGLIIRRETRKGIQVVLIFGSHFYFYFYFYFSEQAFVRWRRHVYNTLKFLSPKMSGLQTIYDHKNKNTIKYEIRGQYIRYILLLLIIKVIIIFVYYEKKKEKKFEVDRNQSNRLFLSVKRQQQPQTLVFFLPHFSFFIVHYIL